jgi:hypothetical protein
VTDCKDKTKINTMPAVTGIYPKKHGQFEHEYIFDYYGKHLPYGLFKICIAILFSYA